jgi:hypothetical protein
LVGFQRDDISRHRAADIVDQDVDPAERLHAGGDRLVEIGRARHVAGPARHGSMLGHHLDRAGERTPVAVGTEDAGTLAQHHRRGGPAIAPPLADRARAEDQRGLPLQPSHASSRSGGEDYPVGDAGQMESASQGR